MENNLVLFSFARTAEKCELLLIYARASERRLKERPSCMRGCNKGAEVAAVGGGMDRRDYKLAR